MQRFYYDTLKTCYNDKVILSYTDTDSFILGRETKDVYADFLKPKFDKYMDFSHYDKTHTRYNAVNQKVLGKFKDEENEKLIK